MLSHSVPSESVQSACARMTTSRFKSLCDDIDEDLDVPMRPGQNVAVVQLDEFGLPVRLPNPPNSDELGLPILRWGLTCNKPHARAVDEPCISTMSLKGVPLSKINRLWFYSIRKIRLADPLSELSVLVSLVHSSDTGPDLLSLTRRFALRGINFPLS